MKKIPILLSLIFLTASVSLAQQTTYRADKIIAKKHFQLGNYVIQGFTTGDYDAFLDSNKVPTSKAVRSFISRRLDTTRSVPSALVTHWQLDSTVTAGGGGSLPTNLWKTDAAMPAGSMLQLAGGDFILKSGGTQIMNLPQISEGPISIGWNSSFMPSGSVVIGSNSGNLDVYTTTVGVNSSARKIGGIALGAHSYVDGEYSIGLGYEVTNYDDNMLYVTNHIQKMHLNLDSSSGAALNMVGIDNLGNWHRYAVPGGGGTSGLNAVLDVDSVGNHNIFLRGSKSFSAQSDGVGFGEATLYHTEGTGGQIFLSRSSGYGANLMPVTGATRVSTNYLPDTTGIYTMYVNGVAPNSKGKLNLYNFPDSIVTPIIKSKGGSSLQFKIGSNAPLILNSDGTMTAGGNIFSPYTFEGYILKANGLVQTPATGYFDFNSRSKLYSPTDGQILLRNNVGTDFGMLQFGGTTSSFPSLKRNGTKLQVRLGDDSDFGAVEGSNIRTGTGNPESVVNAPVGAVYSRTDGSADSSVYIKTSGTGSIGWKKITDVSKYADSIALLRFRLDSLESILLPLDSLDVDESLTKSKVGNVTTLGVNSSNYYDRTAVDGFNNSNFSSTTSLGDTAFVMERNGGTKDTIQFPQKKYREYVAILNQTGSNAPTATVISNELGTITFSYDGVGYYKAHSSALFTVGKTIVFFTSGNVNSGNVVSVQANATSDSLVELSTGYSLAQSDDTMVNDNLIIRVYN